MYIPCSQSSKKIHELNKHQSIKLNKTQRLIGAHINTLSTRSPPKKIQTKTNKNKYKKQKKRQNKQTTTTTTTKQTTTKQKLTSKIQNQNQSQKNANDVCSQSTGQRSNQQAWVKYQSNK